MSSVTSVEIKTPSKVDSKSTEETVQFKMEPYESGANVQGGQDDTFGDDPLEDSQADDADDYSVMEGSEEEPQAGTSGDAVGEGQGMLLKIVFSLMSVVCAIRVVPAH